MVKYDIKDSQINFERYYHSNLQQFYKTLVELGNLHKLPWFTGNLFIWGAGYGFEIPKERSIRERIIAIDVDEGLVKELRKKGITAYVGDFLKDWGKFNISSNDIVILSLLLSQLVLFEKSNVNTIENILQQWKKEGKKIIVLDTLFQLHNAILITYNFRQEIFDCMNYIDGELTKILNGNPSLLISSSDSGPIILNPLGDVRLENYVTQWLIFAWFINFKNNEVKEIASDYIRRIGRKNYINPSVLTLKKCINDIKKRRLIKSL